MGRMPNLAESNQPSGSRVAELLSRTFEIDVQLSRTHRIEPWSVARCYLESDSTDVPDTAIVKWLRTSPEDVRTKPAQLATERSALEFVAELDATLAPRLLAADLAPADPGAGFLVLEDLDPREPLRQVLLDHGLEAAGERLRGFGRALGRLHAASVGRSEEYYAIRKGIDPKAGIELSLGRWRDGVRQLEEAGAAMPSAAAAELADVVRELSDPGPFFVLSSGDPGVNNYLVDALVDDADGRLIDFEAAGFRHALFDLVNDLYLPGSMWITVADPIETGVEAAYRDTLAEAVPEVTDDRRFGTTVAGAGIVFAALRLLALPRLDARGPGHQSRRQRISTLDAAGDTAERHHCLLHLTGWVRTASKTLRRRWPDADLDPAALAPYTSMQ